MTTPNEPPPRRYETRTWSSYWTCAVCGKQFPPQMVCVIFEQHGTNWNVIGKQCLHHEVTT